MAKSLWQDFHGEPFLVNPHLLIANPKGRSMAKHHRRRRNRPRLNPRRRHRRNYMVPGVIPMNPHHRRRSNPRRRHRLRNPRRHYRRNPGLIPAKLAGFSLPPLNQSVAAAAGFLAPGMIEGFILPMVPTFFTGTIGRWILRIGVVIGLGAAAHAFDPRLSMAVLIGGGVYLLTRALAEFMPGTVPGLSAYWPAHTGVRYYAPDRFISAPFQPVSGGGSRTLSAYAGPSLLSTSGRLSPQGRYGV